MHMSIEGGAIPRAQVTVDHVFPFKIFSNILYLSEFHISVCYQALSIIDREKNNTEGNDT